MHFLFYKLQIVYYVIEELGENWYKWQILMNDTYG